MAKLFYTLKEASNKLKMTEDQVKQLVNSGQLQEFRDRDRLMFKINQVNLLASGDTEEDDYALLNQFQDCKTLEKSVGRFNDFNTAEREIIRRALLTLRTARKDSARDVDDLINELDCGISPPRKNIFARLFG